MPRIPKPADLREPTLAPAGNAPQIDIGVASRIGAAGKAMGNAVAALGGAFGEIAGRVNETQQATNYANYKLEWMKGDSAITQDIASQAGEDGALWQTAPERYNQLNADLDKRFPVTDPKRKQDLEIWRETNTWKRGRDAAVTYQGAQANVFLRDFQADVSGVEQRVLEGDIDPAQLEEYSTALGEKLDGLDRRVMPQSEVEKRKREIQGRLTGAFARALVTPGSKFYDPDAAAKLADEIDGGKYEIDEEVKGRGVGPQSAIPSGVGSVSAKYESGGRGVGFVSTGYKDPGGQSYGIHQLSSKDSMPAFLRSPEGQKYAGEFKGKSVGSSEFNAVYKKIAAADPEGFAGAQHAYYSRTHFKPVLEHARALGFNVEDRGVQEALFSMSVQHGGAKKIVSNAKAAAGKDSATQIKELFDRRADYVRGVDLPEETRTSVLNRYRSEVKDALKFAGHSVGSSGATRVASLDARAGTERISEERSGKITEVLKGTPEEKAAKLREIVSQGYQDIVHQVDGDGNDVIVAKQGSKPAWQRGRRGTDAEGRSPNELDSEQFAGPAWANEVVAELKSGKIAGGRAAPKVAEFVQLAEAARANPDQPLSDVLDANAAAQLKAVAPDLDIDNMTAGQALEMLDGVSVGDAAGALDESGLSAEQAASMFEGGNDNPAPQAAAMNPMRVSGRLVQGQKFTVKTARGEFSISAEALNAMPVSARKEYAAMAREASKIAAAKRERQADAMKSEQLAYLEQFGKDAPGFDMAMLEKHYGASKSEEFPKFKAKVTALRALNRAFEGSGEMDVDILTERVERLKPKEGEPHVAERAEAYSKGQAKLDKIVEQRRKDPAAAVEQSRMVASVRAAMPGGNPTNPAENLALVDARMKAQADIGIPEHMRSPITSAEARGMAMRLEGIEQGRAYDALNGMANDIRKKYGERWSGMIMDKVIKTAVTDKERRDELKATMMELDESGSISGSSLERMREKARLDAMPKQMKAPEPPRKTMMERLYNGYSSYMDAVTPKEIQQGVKEGVYDRLRGIEPPPNVQRRTPPKAAVDMLKRDPTKALEFEKHYGLSPGESRKFLFQ